MFPPCNKRRRVRSFFNLHTQQDSPAAVLESAAAWIRRGEFGVDTNWCHLSYPPIPAIFLSDYGGPRLLRIYCCRDRSRRRHSSGNAVSRRALFILRPTEASAQ